MSDDESSWGKHVFSFIVAMVAYGVLRASGLQGKMELSNKNVPTRSSFKTEPYLMSPSVTICPMVNGIPTVKLLRLSTLRVADALDRRGEDFHILKKDSDDQAYFVPIPNDGEKPINTSRLLDDEARSRNISFRVLPFSISTRYNCANIEIRGLTFNSTYTQLVVGVRVEEVPLSNDLYRAVTWGLYYIPEDPKMVYPRYGNLTDYATLFTAPHSHYTFASLKQSNTTVTRMVEEDEKKNAAETSSPSPSSPLASTTATPTPSTTLTPSTTPSTTPSGPPSPSPPTGSSTPSPSPPVEVEKKFQIASYDVSAQSVTTKEVSGNQRIAWLRLNFDDFLVHTVEEREDRPYDGLASEFMLLLTSLSVADILPKILDKIADKIMDKLRKKKKTKSPRPTGRELDPVPPSRF